MRFASHPLRARRWREAPRRRRTSSPPPPRGFARSSPRCTGRDGRSNAGLTTVEDISPRCRTRMRTRRRRGRHRFRFRFRFRFRVGNVPATSARRGGGVRARRVAARAGGRVVVRRLGRVPRDGRRRASRRRARFASGAARGSNSPSRFSFSRNASRVRNPAPASLRFFRALNGGGDGLARLVSLAILAPESLGADTVGGRMDDVHQLAGAAARLLQPMMGEGAAPEVGPTRRAAREHVRRALTIRGDRFDLGHANLFTAEGLAAARRLSAGYRALANVNLLRALLPPEGPASRARLARRLMLVASRVGPDASPARRGAGKALVTLGAHLGVSAEFIAAIVLGDEPPELSARGSGSADGSSSHPRVKLGMADGEGVMMGGEGVGEGGARPPRRARDARRAAEAGEAFLQNFPKDVTAACRWHFDKYARTLTRRVVDGGFGETAALRLLTAVLEPPSGSGSASFVEMKILESVAPHLETLATLAKPPRETFDDEKAKTFGLAAGERASPAARGDGDGVSGEDSTLVRRQRILLGLARRLFALDAACAGLGPGRRRVLFPPEGRGDAVGIVARRGSRGRRRVHDVPRDGDIRRGGRRPRATRRARASPSRPRRRRIRRRVVRLRRREDRETLARRGGRVRARRKPRGGRPRRRERFDRLGVRARAFAGASPRRGRRRRGGRRRGRRRRRRRDARPSSRMEIDSLGKMDEPKPKPKPKPKPRW